MCTHLHAEKKIKLYPTHNGEKIRGESGPEKKNCLRKRYFFLQKLHKYVRLV